MDILLLQTKKILFYAVSCSKHGTKATVWSTKKTTRKQRTDIAMVIAIVIAIVIATVIATVIPL